ncbi:hypothetical protein AGR4B_pAt20187 [Agrobacterium tumefaciens str. CFBP 5621]|nr:hypothetical protein AGR4B_pAt20187 [Agrobacterium tumefaciens str. CFBP 5621]
MMRNWGRKRIKFIVIETVAVRRFDLKYFGVLLP